jgi:hypothetical protein
MRPASFTIINRKSQIINSKRTHDGKGNFSHAKDGRGRGLRRSGGNGLPEL